MENIIQTNREICVGCNRCVRECPMELANKTYLDEAGNIKVEVDHAKCITCGRCVSACKHEAREYRDDTESFLYDLSAGAHISLIAAPSVRTNFPEYKRLFTYLRNLGVRKIYDVSLGADICVWAHIRHIEQNGSAPMITQPCPVIVSYCEIYRHDLLDSLSPIHSPMACIAIYMKEYEGIKDHIAALSPCIAKSDEFAATELSQYNVTFAKLRKHLEENNIELPKEETGFDHYESGLGSLFSMPGGLKENIEFYFGKKIYVSKAEGYSVFEKLNKFPCTSREYLPRVFDVLNCIEGCNIGSAVLDEKNTYMIDSVMQKNRDAATDGHKREYFDSLYKTYDSKFLLSKFIRKYQAIETTQPQVTDEDIQKAFALLGKNDHKKQTIDCEACGSDSCHDMARKIALGVNIPKNCIVNAMETAKEEHERNINTLDQLEMIWNYVESGIAIIDAETRTVIDVNPAAVRMFGDDMEKMIGMSCYSLFGQHECPILDLGNDLDRAERNFIKSDGTMIPVQKSVSKIDYNGHVALLENFIDVAYLKEAEAQKSMLEMAERMQIMFDATPYAAHFYDKTLKLVDCNEAAVKLFGMSSKKEYLERFAEFTPEFQPDGRRSKDTSAEMVKKAFQDGYLRIEYMRQLSNGEPVPVEATLIRVDHTDESFVVAYSRDLREYKKMMEEISYRDKLLSAVNNAANVLLTADNEETFEASLLSGMEFMGHCVNADRVYIIKNEIINGEQYFVYQYEWTSDLGKQGTHISKGTRFPHSFDAEWSQKFLQGECLNGPLTSLSPNIQKFFSRIEIRSVLVMPIFIQEHYWGLASFSDCGNDRFFTIDEINILRSGVLMMVNAIIRNEMTQNIQNTAAKLDAVIANYSGVIWSLDKDGIITLFNGLYLKKIGVEPSFIEGKTLDVALRKNRHFDIAENVKKAMAEGPQDWISDIDGKKFHARITPIFDDSGNVSGVVGSIDDLTEMIELRDKLKTALNEAEKASQLAEQASLAKSSFLASMSHEIRTPMNAIIGMAQIAAKTDEVEKLKYCLANIENSSAHLLGIINDILDLSKIEAGKLELDHTSMNIEKMLVKVCNIMTEKIEQKNIKFNIVLGTNMRMHYIGDELRLSQVITNLLSNAVKFTPVGGTIELTANEEKIEDDHSVLRFSVKDSGIGMTTEQIKRLFTAFEQAESSTTRKFGGTGLGLAISKSIVEKMDGTIWVESETDKGSEFIFIVKLERPAKQSGAVIYGNVSPSDIKLLIVDPDKEERKYFKLITGSFGITADEAENVAQALDMATMAREMQKPYDVVFVDYSLADEKGVEFIQNSRFRIIKNNVIIMTTFLNWNKIGGTLHSVGVNKFIPKPLFPSSILNTINEVIGGEAKNLDITSENIVDMPDFSEINLLVAEDVEINREIFIALLEDTKVHIDIAENGLIAVEKFKENHDKYDIIIMDVQMPEMDGLEASRTIRALDLERAKDIPIIAMTANVFKEDIDKCIENGMTDHLAKPIELEAVIKKIMFYSSKRV